MIAGIGTLTSEKTLDFFCRSGIIVLWFCSVERENNGI